MFDKLTGSLKTEDMYKCRVYRLFQLYHPSASWVGAKETVLGVGEGMEECVYWWGGRRALGVEIPTLGY